MDQGRNIMRRLLDGLIAIIAVIAIAIAIAIAINEVFDRDLLSSHARPIWVAKPLSIPVNISLASFWRGAQVKVATTKLNGDRAAGLSCDVRSWVSGPTTGRQVGSQAVW